MKDKLHRSLWFFMALLFIVTALGVGVYAFWVNTHSSTSSNYIQCASGGTPPNQQPSNGKYKDAKLASFTPLNKKLSYEKCTDYTVGTGATVSSSQATVTVLYAGALASNGVIFDSSYDSGQPLTIRLDQVIPGWTDGLQGMKAGGVRRLFIPAQYGYGSYAQTGIPANSDLVFDIHLLSVK